MRDDFTRLRVADQVLHQDGLVLAVGGQEVRRGLVDRLHAIGELVARRRRLDRAGKSRRGETDDQNCGDDVADDRMHWDFPLN